MLVPSPPRNERGNIVVDLGEDDYNRGVEELLFSVVGRLFLRKGTYDNGTQE